MSGVPEMRSSSSCSLNCANVNSGEVISERAPTDDNYEVFGDDFMKPSDKVLNLFGDGRIQAEIGRQLDELSPILQSDRNGLPTWFQRKNPIPSELQVVEVLVTANYANRKQTSSASTLKVSSNGVGSFSRIQQREL